MLKLLGKYTKRVGLNYLTKNFSKAAVAKVKLNFIDSEGEEYKIDVDSGDNLLEAAWDDDVPIPGSCAGGLVCGDCHCYFENPEKLSEMDEEEEDILESSLHEVKEGSRLACQIIIEEDMDGMTIEIPEE